MKKDIENLDEVKLMVNTFYDRIQKDNILGPIFEDEDIVDGGASNGVDALGFQFADAIDEARHMVFVTGWCVSAWDCKQRDFLAFEDFGNSARRWAFWAHDCEFCVR